MNTCHAQVNIHTITIMIIFNLPLVYQQLKGVLNKNICSVLECLSHSHAIVWILNATDLAASLWQYWSCHDIYKWGLPEGSEATGAMFFMGILTSLPHPSCFLKTMRSTTLPQHTLSIRMVSLTLSPRIKKSRNHKLKPHKLWAQINYFFQLFCQWWKSN